MKQYCLYISSYYMKEYNQKEVHNERAQNSFNRVQQFPVRFLRTHDDLNAVPKFYTYSDQNPDVLILYG